MNPYLTLTTQIMAAAIMILHREEVHKETANRDKWLNTYDYIVVGSGSAGIPVAYRLTENPKITVLLLEAGGRQSVVTDIPENYITNINTEYDWGYLNVRQREPSVGLAFKNQRIPQNRGKVLGGSSTLNAIIHNRGNRRDYDNWAKKYGAKGWSYKEVLKYFRKFENNTEPKIIAENPEYHGKDGPVQISSWKDPEPIISIHHMILNDMGFPNVDVNGPEQVGTCILQAFQRKDGMRSSTANSYIDPNPHKNLHILTKAFVTKILFNEKNGLNAEGVEFFKNDKQHKVRARREVIISGGAINSPQLLMLSGIGPKEHLKQMGIPVKVDLPVGNNLQDHPSITLNTLVADPRLVKTGPILNVNQMHEFFKNGSGPLAEFFNSITYFNTKYNDDPKWPDVAFETHIQRFPDNFNSPVMTEFDNKEAWDEYYQPFLDKYYLFFQAILMKVKSYGKLRLASKNPFDYPLIDPKFLSHSQDYKAMFEVTKFVLKFLIESPFKKYVVPLRSIPGCGKCLIPKFHKCDKYIHCLIEQLTHTGYHPIGTVRMGDISRDDVVVDPRLKVKGVGSLRVCDSSIMPEMINSNTNAASIMIGEKCADLIKEDNRGGYGSGGYGEGGGYGKGSTGVGPYSDEKPNRPYPKSDGNEDRNKPIGSSEGVRPGKYVTELEKEDDYVVIKPRYDKGYESNGKSERLVEPYEILRPRYFEN